MNLGARFPLDTEKKIRKPPKVAKERGRGSADRRAHRRARRRARDISSRPERRPSRREDNLPRQAKTAMRRKPGKRSLHRGTCCGAVMFLGTGLFFLGNLIPPRFIIGPRTVVLFHEPGRNQFLELGFHPNLCVQTFIPVASPMLLPVFPSIRGGSWILTPRWLICLPSGAFRLTVPARASAWSIHATPSPGGSELGRPWKVNQECSPPNTMHACLGGADEGRPKF